MAGKYSIIIFKLVEETEDGQFEEVKRIKAHDLESAKSIFHHQECQLGWSQQHKVSMGLDKTDRGVIQLFDHRENFELQEGAF